jgi:diguanylate cyclase (GGDEF)-like protein
MIDLQKIWKSSQLPTLPSVAKRLLEMARNPETEFEDVIKVVKTDPAITAKILKAANSSFFGFKSPVTSIERAVPLLGTTVATTLALSFSLVDAAMTSGPLAKHYNNYWKQSIVQACAGEVLAERHAQGLSGECFLTGLLLDLGRLAMLKTVPMEYVPVLAEWEQKGGPLSVLEKAALGTDHVRVGTHLMQDWKLPDELIAAVKLHESPPHEVLLKVRASAVMERIAAVAAAAGDYFCSSDRGAALERVDKLTAGFFKLDQAARNEYLQLTRARIDQAGNLFAVNFDELGESAELMAEANEQLARLAMREHMASTQMELQCEAAQQARQELESRNIELQERAIRDALTGLYNRTFFAEALNTAIGAASRSAIMIGVVFSDIDHFKKLNDTCGHQFGDEVLRGVANIHRDALRKSDIVARYGGEEFVALVQQPTEKGMEKLAERLRKSVESTAFVHDGTRMPVTISIGAAISLPERDPGDLALRLVAAADQAMYESKHGGRNQVHVCSLIEADDRRLAQMVAEKRFSRWLVQHNLFEIPVVSQALLNTPSERFRIGSLAQLLGFLTPAQIEAVRQHQESSGKRFGRCCVNCGYLTEDQLAVLLAIQAEPPSLLARALTTMGLLTRERADALLSEYREAISTSAPSLLAVV